VQQDSSNDGSAWCVLPSLKVFPSDFCVIFPAKFGVSTRELPDGLEVYGRPLSSLNHGASIHCYDDHRVAMAFSVLGTVVDGTILEEKRCVEKTWPNWWDDLENKVRVTLISIALIFHARRD